ncbi:class I SAM-dependent methyltransferase [Legionella impletisoli]|uniref:Methyltransferase n=1 Tax=Legionella impletisoli TaxID=343510 RepID=A0A917NDL0_9GAMM|nr:class I SAM-dependent methyltransferase [Legionella impletisoli]GGI90204.1 methyltransferase [Legionella impletisoli]
MKKIHDLFTQQAALYAQFRPNYPREMLDWIVKQCYEHKSLWDCGTGTGQVAFALADKFDQVIATDVNAAQLAHASHHPKIIYKQTPSEQTDLPNKSIDLITVAQALHWFDHTRFNKEVKRVLKPRGILAVWCYGLVRTNNSELNQIIHTFYTEITAPYWEPERQYIDNKYEDIPIPFTKLKTPSFNIKKYLSKEDLIAYVSTWSAVNTFTKETGLSLIDTELKPQLEQLTLPKIIECQWPITLIVTRA